MWLLTIHMGRNNPISFCSVNANCFLIFSETEFSLPPYIVIPGATVGDPTADLRPETSVQIAATSL